MALDKKTIRTVQERLGPWFLLDENNRSAPGVNWEKFVSLVQRGKVAAASIVRGPVTGGLWRRAQDTPSVATLLGMCWSCHAELPDRRARRCPQCRHVLNGPAERGPEWAKAPVPLELPSPSALDDLARASSSTGVAAGAPEATPPEVRAGGFISMLILLVGAMACYGIFWSAFRIAGGRGADRSGGQAVRPSQPGGGQDPAGPPGESLPEAGPGHGAPLGRAASTSADEDELPRGELARRHRAAEGLLKTAKALEEEGKLAEAEEALLRLLNDFRSDAWPAGTLEALQRVQRARTGRTGQRPSFFGSEPP